MYFTLISDLPACSRNQMKTCGGSTNRRSTSSSGLLPKGCFGLFVILVLVTLQFSSSVQAASVNKRSADHDENCRTNAICGWEVYHPSTRNLQYYVASSCKCSSSETCLRADDDISISAYVFRCRDARRRARRPATMPNEISS